MMTEQKHVIPEGYKQTEVGVIPNDWAVSDLKSIIDTERGIRYGIVQPGNFDPNGILMVRGQDYSKGWVTEDKLFKVSPFIDEKYKNARLKKNDLILTIVGAGTGYIELVPVWLDGANLTQTTARLTLKSDKAYYIYCKYALLTKDTQKIISSFIKGNAQPGLNCADIYGFKVALPQLEEQTAIANALSDVDALISELEKLIAKKQAIKTATMQQLLTGKTRLPEFALREDGTPKGYKQSELGEIPEDWEVKTVYDLADNQKAQFDDGDWIEAEHITDKGIRLIQTGNIGVGLFVDKNAKKYIYETSFEKLKCKALIKGDVLICRLAEPAGRACILPDIGEDKVITSVDVTIFRPSDNSVSREFYVQYFSSDEWFKNVLEQVGGTTHKRISRGALGKINVPLPSINEQNVIASILSCMDSDLQNIQKRLDKTRQIKQGMMQELLTGKTRLVKPEVMV